MTMMSSITRTVLLGVMLVLLLSTQAVTGQISICIRNCEDDPSTPSPTPSDPTIVGMGRRNPQFSALLATMDAVGLSTALQADGPFTLFAPTNNAFTLMTGTAVGRWVQQPEVWKPHVIDLLSHHVIEDELLSLELNQQPIGMELYSAQGSPITITSTNPLQLEEIPVVTTDILGSNGVMHSINSPLLTPAANQDLVQLLRDMPFLSTLVRLLDQADLLKTLQGQGPFTLLAPTNEAFERVSAQTMALWESDPELLAESLLFHVAPGNFLESNFRMEAPITRFTNATAPVSIPDILVGDTLVSNGVLHMVDRLQKLPETMAPTPAPAPTSLVGILQGRGEFNMLLDSLETTGRLRDLQINGRANPFTIFAPKDSSFVTNLPEKFLDETWQTHLINVLTYHIVRGNLLPANFTAVGQRLPTLNFNSLEITALGPPQVNGINIVESIQADNGVIHVVDAMLLPPSATSYVIDLYALFPEFQTLLDRIGITNLTTTLSTEGPMTMFSPVDGAFANLLNPNIYRIEDPEIWKQILMYHIVPGQLINFASLVEEYTTKETLPPREEDGLIVPQDQDDEEEAMLAMMGNMTNVTEIPPPPPLHTFQVTTLQGSNITLTVQPNNIGTANILFEDLLVKNGIVQVIDEVLIPPNLTLPFAPLVTPQEPIGPDAGVEQEEEEEEALVEATPVAAVEREGDPFSRRY